MKKIFMMIVIAMMCAFTSYADDVKIDYEIGQKSDNYIIVNADYTGLTNVNVKYYLNPSVDGDRLTETIYFSPSNNGNIYIHNIAIYWNGTYYKKQSGDSIVTVIWTSQTTSNNAPYSSIESTDVYWLKMREDTTKSVYKLPYISGFQFEASGTTRNTIDIRFYKQNNDVITSLRDIHSTAYVITRYDLSGRVVDDTYRGVVIEQYNDGTIKKVIKK